MKNSMRLTALLIIVSIFLSACLSVGDNSNNGITVTTSLEGKPVLVGNIECTFPLTKKNTEFNILVTGYGEIQAEDVFVWQKYEEMTGIKVNWTTVTKSQRNEYVNNVLTTQAPMDLILRCKISSSKLTQYGESGLILNLAKDDMLKKYAPNCWAYLLTHSDSLASIMNPDGSIYALPQVNSGAELRVSRKIYVNKKWLENLGLELPTTTEEMYQLLKAFKEKDANGNGDPNDEIPFCSQDWVSVQDVFYGAFGLGNRGNHNTVVDYDNNTRNIRLIAASDEYKAFLEYMNKLYLEELLDKYTFTITMDQWINNAVNDRIGVFANTNLATMPSSQANNWVAIEEALEGPFGDKMWAPIRANFQSTGAAVIPSTCSDPELVLRWLDYFWTDEGSLFYHMGIENKSFVVNSDGSYDYIQKIYDDMESGNLSFDDSVARYTPYPGGSNPTVEIAPYFGGGEMADIPSSAARALFNYGPDEYWPSFTFTTEENEALSVYESDINKYCTSSRVDFVTGVRPFTEWNKYIDMLDTLGKDELLTIYQAAVDRYSTLSLSDNREY